MYIIVYTPCVTSIILPSDVEWSWSNRICVLYRYSTTTRGIHRNHRIEGKDTGQFHPRWDKRIWCFRSMFPWINPCILDSISIFICFCWFCWWQLPIFPNQSPFWLVTTPRFSPIFPLASRWWGFPWPAGVDFGLPGASNGRRIFAGLKPGSAATWSDRFFPKTLDEMWRNMEKQSGDDWRKFTWRILY